MAVIEYDEYKQKLQALEPTLQELEKALAIPKAREELAQLQKETEQEGFWSDVERSQKVSQQIKRLESKVRKYDRLVSDWEDTLTLCEMAQEEDDASLLPEVTAGYDASWFVENFGCDAYFRHNRELLFDDTRHRIREEIEAARAAGSKEETKDE